MAEFPWWFWVVLVVGIVLVAWARHLMSCPDCGHMMDWPPEGGPICRECGFKLWEPDDA